MEIWHIFAVAIIAATLSVRSVVRSDYQTAQIFQLAPLGGNFGIRIPISSWRCSTHSLDEAGLKILRGRSLQQSKHLCQSRNSSALDRGAQSPVVITATPDQMMIDGATLCALCVLVLFVHFLAACSSLLLSAVWALPRSLEIAKSTIKSEFVKTTHAIMNDRSTPVAVIVRALKSPAIPVHQ